MSLFTTLTQDPAFWVAVSTVLCIGFIALKAYKPILAGLDARAQIIRQRLDEAAQLHAEAAKILEDYKQKSLDASKEAEAVMRNAQLRADKLRQEMEDELRHTIERQEASVKLRINRLEAETIETVKMAIIDAALVQVRTRLVKEVDGIDDLDASLKRIAATLN